MYKILQLKFEKGTLLKLQGYISKKAFERDNQFQ